MVRVLLDGRPADGLPEWRRIDPAAPAGAATVDVDWLVSLRDEARTAFRAAGWPDPDDVRVLVDSAECVRQVSGWDCCH